MPYKLEEVKVYYDLSDFDDEESFEPPSLEEYNKLLKLLKSNGIDYNIVEKYK